jgi:ABC-2 type transport system ATP-binding protein
MSDLEGAGQERWFEADRSVWERLERHANKRPGSTASSLSGWNRETVTEQRVEEESQAPDLGAFLGPPAVEVAGLTKVYGDMVAVDQLTLSVQRGEFFGFLGPNGAGKSTTIKMLSGLIQPTSGSARVAGIDVLANPIEVKRRMGILPEEVHTYERLTGFELLTFVGRLYDMDEMDIYNRAVDLFRVLDFTPEEASKLIIDYSMGMKKKIALASAIIHNPEVLFLDEPFNGIDAVTSRSIRHILQRAVRSGVTIFFSSHVLEVVERLCSRIAIINQGKLVAMGTLDEIRRSQAVSGDTGLDDLFVQLVGGAQTVEELDWLRPQELKEVRE